MANNYLQSSTFVSIPKEKIEQAKHIIDEVQKVFLDSGEIAGYCAEVKGEGIWIYGEESIDYCHVEVLMRELVEMLHLDGVFVCSWAYTCTKPRIDEFGGGAFAVVRGHDTIWIDAAEEVVRLAKSKIAKTDSICPDRNSP